MKKYFRYIPIFVLFIFIFIFNLLFIPNNLDEIWNYGFSYAIRLGEVPYKDFNMVLTPLYSFIMTIPLLINNSYLSFIIFHSLVITLEFYLLYKMIGKKSYILLLVSSILFPLIYPTYNSFFLFLMIFICYLEDKNFKLKDYIIGFLIACCILTKQSVGIFFIIPSLLFIKKNDISIIKRLLGFIIPNFIFLLYLMINKCLYSFFDLCFLGLIEFSGNNIGFGLSFLLFIIILVISIYLLIRNKGKIINYYVILSYLLFVPSFDNLHLFYVIFSFCLLFLINIKEIKIKYELLFYPCMIVIIFVFGKTVNVMNYKKNSLSHFEYKNIYSDRVISTKKIVEYIKENDAIIYNDDSYFYRVCANQKIGYLDLLNHGNHGYSGSEKLIKLIKTNKEKKYLIDKNLETRMENKETQMDYKAYSYIVSYAKKVGEIENFYIYSFDYE